MKLKLIFLITALLVYFPTHAMQQDKTSATNLNSPIHRGWLERWLPATYDNADKGTQAFYDISQKGLTVNHNLDAFTESLSKDGVKMFADPVTIQELNKSGVSLMKTYLTAGIGAAISLAGVFLLFKTLKSKGKQDPNEQKPDLRPLYKKLLTNRYLISGLLMASGIGIIIKSDTIVTKLS